jgi:hypothetical protein
MSSRSSRYRRCRSPQFQHDSSVVEDISYRIDERALPAPYVRQMALRTVAVAPVELEGPGLRGTESASQAIGQRIEIVAEVSAGAVDRPADLAVETFD